LHPSKKITIVDIFSDRKFRNHNIGPWISGQALADTEIFTNDFIHSNPTEELRTMFKSFAESGRKGLLSQMKALSEPGEDLDRVLERYLDDPRNRNHINIKERKLDLDGFNVIIHNDAWFNNMLFK
jgi:hypothetical protein